MTPRPRSRALVALAAAAALCACGDSRDAQRFLHKDWKVRQAAQRSAQKWSLEKKRRVAKLLRQELKSTDIERVRFAADGFINMGRAGYASIEELARVYMSSRDHGTQEACGYALKRIPGSGKVARPMFEWFPGGRDPKGRQHAVYTLLYLSRGSPALLEPARRRLKEPDPDVRELSALVLGDIGSSAAREAVPDLIAALQDKASQVRRAALHSLSNAGSHALAAVPEIVATIDRHPEDRQECYAALDELKEAGKADPAKRPPRFESPYLFRLSYRRIGGPFPSDLETHPWPFERKVEAEWIKAQHEKAAKSGVDERLPVVESLARSDTKDPKTEELVRVSFRKSTDAVRHRYAELILKANPADAEVCAWLLDGVRRLEPAAIDQAVRSSAAAEGARILLERLRSGASPELGIVYSLGQLGPPADALPDLTARLERGNAAMRSAAAWAIGRMGPAGRPARSGLKSLRRDPSASVRRHAEHALDSVGEDRPWWKLW